MQRITRKMLEAKLATAAKLTGRELVLSGAYGGWAVFGKSGEHGGMRDLTAGHWPARQTATFLDGMIEGARKD